VLSRSGFLMDASKPFKAYVRLTAADVLSINWTTHTAEELQAMAGGDAA
jgi:hypothetical protein